MVDGELYSFQCGISTNSAASRVRLDVDLPTVSRMGCSKGRPTEADKGRGNLLGLGNVPF